MDSSSLAALRKMFGDRCKENVPLSGYTAARIGGPADALIFARSADELEQTVTILWKMDVPFIILGGGSNVLISDQGVRGVVVLNRARQLKFNVSEEPPIVHAESGATLNDIAQRAERKGLTGFEWAASVPGSLGGAIYGNAGAFGGDIAGNLVSVDMLDRRQGRQVWPMERMEYGYRSSLLKREHPPVIILSAKLALMHADNRTIRVRMDEFSGMRRSSQPAGASLGSMFKNPDGEKAGRLIDNAGLKGTRIGNAEISLQHANFFINHGKTSAKDMKALMDQAQQVVYEKFGIWLEPEIEIIGEW
jgi:UDP-N-acetylmuramate dehydrogenase